MAYILGANIEKKDILGKVAACNLKKGTAMKWDYLKGDF